MKLMDEQPNGWREWLDEINERVKWINESQEITMNEVMNEMHAWNEGMNQLNELNEGMDERRVALNEAISEWNEMN